MNGTEAAPPAEERAREISAEIISREPPAPEPAPRAVAPREATEVVITQADPDRPKKGGWWQRVRTPFGG
jgi:ribonuclease E